ncbi:hypothetical protein OAK45_08040 [Verrucomicrobia bacterium]|nr:hypothetical protein [Verrucomicrobiota bacterium]
MSFIDDLRKQRQKLADVLMDEEYSGIREIVEELYPDKAHFIYELLQNAEDAGATHAEFILNRDTLIFKHDGRAFNEEDLKGITNIGRGTKGEEEDKIGRFGIGFKAVFAFSETPFVYSSTYCFKITNLVLPEGINATAGLSDKTRFEFPFNNPKKNPEDAFVEIRDGLNQLTDITLLFLTGIKSVTWQIEGEVIEEIKRKSHDTNHVELVRLADGKCKSNSHFLRFTDRFDVDGFTNRHIAVAFELELLPDSPQFNQLEPIENQLRIRAADPGSVAVFFPAKSESSGLRFHLHAPFVPELSRASIKEVNANIPLFEGLAKLSAKCLHNIRDLGLLNSGFLGVLPNSYDSLPEKYSSIRDAIIEEMKKEPLVPKHRKGHAPAKDLLQAKASLKNLLSIEDLKLLVGDEDRENPQWAVGASQKNSDAERFLEDLEIEEWGIDEFQCELSAGASTGYRYYRGSLVLRHNKELMKWLVSKPAKWAQQMYCLFDEEDLATSLSGCKIARVIGGGYEESSKCYFSIPENQSNEEYLCIDPEVIWSGGKKRQERARRFLEDIGVQEYGELQEIKKILKKYYTEEADPPDDTTYKRHLKRFMKYASENSSGVFKGYYIFQTLSEGEESWVTPEGCFLDSPYEETGLEAYCRFVEDSDDDEFEWAREFSGSPLSDKYVDWKMTTQIAKFAKAVGVKRLLDIERVSVNEHPESEKLRSVGGQRATNPINQNYDIAGLRLLAESPTIDLSRLIWRTMLESSEPIHFQAVFRRSLRGGSNRLKSNLIIKLKEAAWVPQGEDIFVKPLDADPGKLPEGFIYDKGKLWLKRIEFGQGENIAKEQAEQEDEKAKQSGFKNAKQKKLFQKLSKKMPDEELEALVNNYEMQEEPALPDHELTDPGGRKERVKKRAKGARGKGSKKGERTESVGIGEIKKEADPYLRSQYTKDDHQMICQICRVELPFRRLDGEYYFETTELFGDIKKLYRENYLALCPNHGAMLKYVNESKDELRKLFEDMTGQYMEVQLAGEPFLVYFTKTHMLDLQGVLEAEDEAD